MAFTRANLLRLIHAGQPPVPPPSGINSQTLRVGYLTLAGAGDVPLDAPGLGVLDDGVTVVSWELVRTSGSSAWPSTVTTGMTPAPTRALTSADGGTAVVYAIHADGQDTGETLTINVQPSAEAAGAYTVSKPADVDSSSIGLRQTAVKSTLGGKVVEIQRGSDASWANPNFQSSSGAANIMRVQTFNTHTGVITFTASDPDNRPKMGRIYIQSSSGLRFTGLRLEMEWSKWPENGVAASTQSSRQNLACLYALGSASTTVTNLEIDNNICGAQDGTDSTQWPTIITVAGGDTEPYLADNINIHDNVLRNVKQGMTWGRVINLTAARNTITNFCGDAINTSGNFRDITIEDNIVVGPYTNAATPTAHRDFCQSGATTTSVDVERLIVRRNVFDLGDGLSSAQGAFVNDVGFNGSASGAVVVLPNGGQYQDGNQRVTGLRCIDCEISNNIYLGGHVNGVVADNGDGWMVRNNFTGRAPALNVVGATSDPTVRSVVLKNSETDAPIISAGDFIGNVSHGNIASAAGISLTDNLNMGPSPGAGPGNYAALMTFYETWFQDPSNPDPLIGFRPIEGGPLSLGGGKYMGALNPDGSWADAR